MNKTWDVLQRSPVDQIFRLGYIDLEVNNNRPTGGIKLHKIERARFLPPIKIIRKVF